LPNSEKPEQPNLVFILPDRLRRDSMACYGNEWIRSPHLNALAEQSFVFENAYVSQSVCAPSRSCILTGMYPHKTSVVVNQDILPPEVSTIAEMIPDEYRTAYFGRWHLGDELQSQHGFDEWVRATSVTSISFRHCLICSASHPRDKFNVRAKLVC
jgi:arylsulfatase A-like enzyme